MVKLSFAANNASVISGIHKGALAYVKKENEHIYFMGNDTCNDVLSNNFKYNSSEYLQVYLYFTLYTS